jgi:hypothetical protein
MGTLPLLNFFVELVDNNRNEQVHDEEGGQEDEDDEEEGDRWIIVCLWNNIYST